jgi:hypothetical protein
MSPDSDFRSEALLSIQRALWDMVTPALRVVAVHLEKSLIRVRFGNDRPLTAEFVPMETSRYFTGDWWWAYLRRDQPTT